MDKNADIIKKTCKEMRLTYKELAEKIGMSEAGVQNAVKKNSISTQTAKAIELLYEIEELKQELKEYENLKQTLKKHSNKPIFIKKIYFFSFLPFLQNFYTIITHILRKKSTLPPFIL